MNRLFISVAVVVMFATTSVSARTNKVTLAIHSNPEGALVIENGKHWGATPFTLVYDMGKFRECQNKQPISVRWASGAEASSAITLCPSNSKAQMITLERPANVDGLALDLQVAFQQAMLAQMQAQTNVLSDLDYQAWLSRLNGSQRAVAAPKPFALCISRDVARGVVYVACQ